MLTGNVLAQALPVLITPFISRLFSVEEFGLFALYSSIATFFMVVAAGRYEMAILLPRDDKDAVNVLFLCVCLIFFTGLVSLLFVIFFQDFVSEFFNNNYLSSWLWFLPLTIVVGALYRTFTYWSNRKQRFKSTSVSVVIQSASRSGITLGGGFYKNEFFEKSQISNIYSFLSKASSANVGITKIGMGSLILGYILGFAIGSFNMIRSFFLNDISLFKEISKKLIITQAKIHINFPKVNALHALFDEVKNGGVAFIIVFLFSESILGLYSMTVRVLTLPIAVIGSAFGQVYLQKAASQYANNQSLTPLIKLTVKKLAIISLPIFFPILLAGPQLFAFILGEEWRLSGTYAQFLSPWLILNFVISPVLQTAVVLGKQSELFAISIIGNLIIFGSIFSGAYFFDSLEIGFIILSSLEILYYFWLLRWIFSITQKSDAKIWFYKID